MITKIKRDLSLPIAGFFMGLANLVPGVSGGTMLLITGVYPRIIQAISHVAKGKLKPEHLITIFLIGFFGIVTIFIASTPLKIGLEKIPWILYSIFIGLTAGGIRPILRQIKKWDSKMSLLLISSFALIAFLITFTPEKKEFEQISSLYLYVSGLACGAAMITPGISGNSLLLAIGSYTAIISILSDFRTAVEIADFSLVLVHAKPLLFFSAGAVSGIALISIIITWLFKKVPNETYCVLLGILCGTFFALWPFGNSPIELIPNNQIIGAVLFAALGFTISSTLDHVSKKREGRNND